MLRKASPVTRALHYRSDTEGAHPSVTPLFQNSAFEADSPYFYTRNDNPNASELETVVALLEEAGHAVSTTTGMTAIALLLSLVPQGGTVVANRHLYGCTLNLLERFGDRGRFRLSVLDLTDPNSLAEIDDQCALVFFETPTNPFLYAIPIAATAQSVRRKAPGALIAVDNTWASSLFQKPLKHGADISLHSATKYLSGHSDVMGGVILTDRDDLADALRAERFYTGAILDPHSAWLLRRSIQTFPLRMQEHQAVVREMAEYLRGFPQIAQVFFPEVDGQQLSGYGCILFFRFAEAYRDSYAEFMSRLEIFQSGTGMAAVTSMVAQPYSGSHASLSEAKKQEMGLGRDVVRLCFGFEPIEDLKEDLGAALRSL